MFREFFINASVLIISSILCLFVAEMVYARYEPEKLRYLFSRNAYTFFQYDPLLGWVNAPGKKGALERPEFTIHVDNNSQGMRGPEVGEKKGFRIAVIGDSFTWGLGVDVEERFTELLQKKLGVEILNFGVSGYGETQHYLTLDKVLSFKPDLVLLAFCPSNDISDNVHNNSYGYYRPYSMLENGALVIKGYPVPRSKPIGASTQPWIGRSALGRIFYVKVQEFFPNTLFEKPPLPPRRGMIGLHQAMVYREPENPLVMKALEVNKALFSAIKKELDTASVPLLVYSVSTKAEWRSEAMNKAIRSQMAQLGIPLVIAKEPFGREYFYHQDGHWNARGHQKAAELLAPALERYTSARTQLSH